LSLMKTKLQAGILPLANLVLFPKTTIFLTIKDARQIDIILEFLRQDLPIAMPLFYHNNFFSTCTRAQVTIIKQDGALITEQGLKLFVNGIDRVQLEIPTMNNAHIYLVTSILDTNEPTKEIQHLLPHLSKEFESWVNRSVPLAEEREYLISQAKSPEGLSYNIAMYMIDDLITKQRCLEIPSLIERLLIESALINKESATLAKQAVALFDAA